jgi:hypothetical protein
MARTPPTVMRLEPALIEEARERAGLPSSTRAVHVVRMALAALAGYPDPKAVMAARLGRPPAATAEGGR